MPWLRKPNRPVKRSPGMSRMGKLMAAFPVMYCSYETHLRSISTWVRVQDERWQCVHHCGLHAFSMPRVSISNPVGGMEIEPTLWQKVFLRQRSVGIWNYPEALLGACGTLTIKSPLGSK